MSPWWQNLAFLTILLCLLYNVCRKSMDLTCTNCMPLVLWCCWLGGRKGIRPVKNWVVGCWRGYLGWGADLHIAQQMPLPLTISCSSKSRLVLLSWFLADRTIGRAFGTMCHLSSVDCLSSVCDVLYCGKTVRPSDKLSEGVNRKPGSKSWFFGSPPYFYFRFRLYCHLLFA